MSYGGESVGSELLMTMHAGVMVQGNIWLGVALGFVVVICQSLT
jgi:hypothetical protein